MGGSGDALSVRKGAALRFPKGARGTPSRDIPGAAKRNAGLVKGYTRFDGVSVTSSFAVWRIERGAFARLSDGATEASSRDILGAVYENPA